MLALGAPWGFAAVEEAKVQEDTPHVQSGMVVVDAMLKMAGVRARDFVNDLGSGVGRIVIQAANRYGARDDGVVGEIAGAQKPVVRGLPGSYIY